MDTAPTTAPDTELTVDELATRLGLPVRTIREYQTMGLLAPPERRGRVGIYRAAHVVRLELISRLQKRGYSLAGIRDLVGSWRDGADLGEVLGLQPDQLVHLDEPGTPATLDQLAILLPSIVPHRLDEIVACGLVDVCGPNRYCVPSPSLLQLTIDAVAAGYPPDRILSLLTTIGEATAVIADAALELLSDRPANADDERLIALATRGRSLLAHGTGRRVIYAIGQRLGITDDGDTSTALRQLLTADR